MRDRLASELEDHAARGQLDQAARLAQQLETMVRELGRQLTGLSVEDLHRLASTVQRG
jgi:hypothetical protein